MGQGTDDMTRRTPRKPKKSISQQRPRAPNRGSLCINGMQLDCYTMADGSTYLTEPFAACSPAGATAGTAAEVIASAAGAPDAVPVPEEVELLPPDNDTVVRACSTDSVLNTCECLLRLHIAGGLWGDHHELAGRAVTLLHPGPRGGLREAIWTASGYRPPAAGPSLAEKHAASLRSEAARWRLFFPRDFFVELGKLYRLPLRGGGRLPRCFAAFLSEFFYEWFDRDVHATLRRMNPRPAKGSNHHQFLTPAARAHFERHLRDVLLLMRASESISDFRMRFRAALDGQGLQLMLRTG